MTEYDEARRVDKIGRGAPGSTHANHPRQFTYNPAQQLASVTEPDGNAWTFSDFDPRGLEQEVSFPGQSTTRLGYDIWGRLTSRDVTRGSHAVNDTYVYDGFDRVRVAVGTHSGVTSRLSTTYDLLGAPNTVTLEASGGRFDLGVVPYDDGTPHIVSYPSLVVEDVRDAFGRLRAKIARDGSSAPILQGATYATSESFDTLTLGNGVVRKDTYDDRKRLVSRKYVLGGTTKFDLRYAYNGANQELGRQAMHKGGRLDVFGYDADNRLAQAELGARPAVGETGNVVADGSLGVLRRDNYGRTYSYGIEDTLHVISTQALSTSPPFVELTDIIDGAGHVDHLVMQGAPYTQGKDELGNTTQLRLDSGMATLEYDGISQLRRVTRADGSVIAYDYRADGALLSRSSTCTFAAMNCHSGKTIYVYAGMLLLEEYEVVAGQPVLRVRYHYEDSDVPIAADIVGPSTTVPERFWLETDRMGSVVGALDGAGNEVERIEYDPFGHPTFLPADLSPPVISSVTRTSGGDWLIAFTEEVLPPPTSPSSATTISPVLASLSGAISAVDHATGQPIDGALTLEDSQAGFAHGTVIRFEPSVAVPNGTHVDLSVQAGSLMDGFSNRVVAATLALTLATGVVYSGPAQGSTSVVPTARSSTGLDVLFQSHLYDDNTGLVLARARVLDPLTGAMLQRDGGFQDSVNLYAFARNNPVMFRDPSGQVAFLPIALAVVFGFAFPHDLGVQEREQFTADGVGAVLSMFGPEIRAIGSPLLRAMVAGGIGGSLSALGVRGTRDVFAGTLSSAGAYAEDTAMGFGLGALVSGAAHGAGVGMARLRDPRESRQVLASVTDGPIDNLGAAAPCPGSCGTALVCFVGGTEVQTATGPRAIESLQVGERVLSKGECPTSETDEGSWVAVHVIAPNLDAPSDPLELKVLKPWAWVEARTSDQEVVELPDFGIATVGTVVGVQPVNIAPGAGCVVRSTITHINNDIWSLDLEGGTRLEPTGLHRFLSADRAEWVATRELYVGERLVTAEGEVTVAGLAWEATPRRVYNLEVESTHTYLVASAQVVTHNADCGRQQSFGFMATMAPMRAPPEPPGQLAFEFKYRAGEQLELFSAKGAGGFLPKEESIADYLRQFGRKVEPNPLQHARGAGRQGDAFVDGLKHEFKTLDPGATNKTISNQISDSIMGGGQARNVVFDARGSGLSREEAQRGIFRSLGASGGKYIDRITVIGDDYFIGYGPKP